MVVTKKDKGFRKAVNVKAKQIVGVARGFRVKMNTWVGWLNFSIMKMDDYPMVLAMELLKKAKATFPLLNLMDITDGSCCVGTYPR